jgi:tape measure domain-containing protein
LALSLGALQAECLVLYLAQPHWREQYPNCAKPLGATAAYEAEIKKLEIALKGVTTNQIEYNDALKFIQTSTDNYAVTQDILTRQFTKLQASVQGSGGSLQDTKIVFDGIVSAVRATGGSLQDVDSALTATAQVFSKGKVSAEELRQQIGERLPGAFTLFAKSMDMTPQAA